MNDKHNYNLSEPLIKKLLEALGSEWKDGSCLNDSCASVYRDFGNDQFMSIYVPNATKTNSRQEEYSNFHVNISDNYYPQYDRIEEVIQSAKDMESEQADAKLLFADSEKIDPSEYEGHEIQPSESVEVHKCKATGWHYLYYTDEREYPYYCCITVDDGEFKTLEELQKWARPLYFQ
jgi:hypothetical protein